MNAAMSIPKLQPSPASAGISGIPFLCFCAAVVAPVALIHQRVEQALAVAFGAAAMVTTVIVWRTRPVLDRAVAALAMLPLTLPVALGAWAAVGQPIIRGGYSDPYAMFAVSFVVFASAPVQAAILPQFGRATVRALLRPERPRSVVAVRPLAWLAIVGAVALVAGANSRVDRLSPERYLATLPIVGRLPPADTDGFASRMDAQGLDSTPQDLVMGALHVRREVLDKHARCRLSVTTRKGLDRSDPSASRTRGPFSSCNALAFRIDEAHGLVIVEEGDTRRTAYDLAHPIQPIDVYAGRVDAVRVPDAFVALAVFGIIVGLVVLRVPTRSLLPLDPAALHEATSLGDGTIILDGDITPLALPRDLALMSGRVVAVLAEHAESFRERAIPRVVRVLPGTLSDYHLAARLTPHALALVFVTVGSAPLAVALVSMH